MSPSWRTPAQPYLFANAAPHARHRSPVLAWLVQHFFEALVHGRLAVLAPGLLAKLRIAVLIELVNRRLAAPADVRFHDLLQALARVVATTCRFFSTLVYICLGCHGVVSILVSQRNAAGGDSGGYSGSSAFPPIGDISESIDWATDRASWVRALISGTRPEPSIRPLPWLM